MDESRQFARSDFELHRALADEKERAMSLRMDLALRRLESDLFWKLGGLMIVGMAWLVMLAVLARKQTERAAVTTERPVAIAHMPDYRVA